MDYSSYKKYYTPGGEFTLSGADYSGYVEIFNGLPCEFRTRRVLAPSQTFATDILTSKYFYDRLVNDEISLPYSLTDITIAPNDYLNYNLIKDRLDKLRENNAYTFSRLFIANNNIPTTDNVTFAAIKNDDDTSFTLLTAFEGNIAFENTSFFSELGNIKSFVGKKNTDLFNNFAFFCITDTKFITLTSNELETSVIEISNKYETVENELEFKDLHGITVNDRFLYISDTGNNVVIKYEIAGYFNNDYALSNKRNFIEVIGGEGSVVDPSRFNGPTEITCNNKYVVVYDSGNYIIKVFDANFNYIRQLRGMPLRKEPLAALEFNPNNNTLYALTYYETNKLKLYVYSSDFVLLEQYILNITLEPTDRVRNITFSQNDSNFWYICTSGYVYKRLINRPDGSLGRFQSQNLFSNNINTLHGKQYNNYRTCRTTAYRELTSYVDETLLTYLSSSTITQSITSISTVQSTLTTLSSTITSNTLDPNIPSTENITISSFDATPILYDVGCAGNTYYRYEDEIPVDNFWNQTKTHFGKSKYFWNVKQTEIETYEQTIIRPIKFYRFVMYKDEGLTQVLGGEPLATNTVNPTAFTGLKNILLNVASQPQNNFFIGFSANQPSVNKLPISLNDTYTTNIKFNNISKSTPLGDYSVSTYASVEGNYGDYYSKGYTVFCSTKEYEAGSNRSLLGWSPSVKGLSATRDTAYLEIELPIAVSLSSIQIRAAGSKASRIITPQYVEVLGSNNGDTFFPIASAKLPSPTTELGTLVNVDIYEDIDSIQTILDSTTRTSLSTTTETSSFVSAFTGLSSDNITTLFYLKSDYSTKYNFFINDTLSTTYQTVISSRKYSTAVDNITATSNNIIVDTYKSCRSLPCTENYDDIILFSSGRIYFIKEPNEYKSVLKFRNFSNFGLNAFSLAGDEYIQASTINKELYKVIHDIFALKNNIVGRFSGKFDSDGVIVLDDYNYNVNYLDVTDQMFKDGYLTQAEFEKYFVNENEKSIVGVLNRALTNIFNLQLKLFEITKSDTQTNIIPIYNQVNCEILE